MAGVLSVCCRSVLAIEEARSRDGYLQFEETVDYRSATSQRYAVMHDLPVEEVLRCKSCNEAIVIRVEVELDNFHSHWGLPSAETAMSRYLLSEDGEIRIPVICPTHGYLGERVYMAPLLQPMFGELYHSDVPAIFTSDRRLVVFGGDTLMFLFYCRRGLPLVVVVCDDRLHEPLFPPTLFLHSVGMCARVTYVRCPSHRDGLSYVRVLDCPCHGFFLLLQVDVILGLLPEQYTDQDGLINFM